VCNLHSRKRGLSAVSCQVPQTPKNNADNDGRWLDFRVLNRADSVQEE
jgi:hypothetical protein